MADTPDACTVLQSLISEYTVRTVGLDETRYRIGDLNWNTETNKLYVCVGKINSSYVWKEYTHSSGKK